MRSARLLLDTLQLRGGPPADRLATAWRAVDVDGRGVRRLVAFEGCSTWLYRRLRQLGVLDQVHPQLGQWVTEKAREETARNMLVDAEARALAEIFHDIGVPAVFLKGVARRLTIDRYPLADARVTNDVDVLVPADRARRAWSALRQAGYERTTPAAPPRPEHHHLPAVWNWRRVAVEVHTTNAPVVSPREAWRRHYENGTDVVRAGVTYRVPPATELLWSGTAHGLRHPEIAFLLVLLFDAAVIWASGAAIDWGVIATRLDAKEIVDTAVAGAWLGAAAQLAGAEWPEALGGRIARYDLEAELRFRLAVVRRVNLPGPLRKALAWWSSERARD